MKARPAAGFPGTPAAAASRVVRIALTAALAVAVLAAISGTASAETHTVTIRFFHFSPESIDVKPGDEVVWVNRDLIDHTVTATDNAFDSKGIARGQSWTWKAGAPGQHAYVCSFHGNMKGVVNVKE
jgi:plastocyanin